MMAVGTIRRSIPPLRAVVLWRNLPLTPLERSVGVEILYNYVI